jgi:hypothetical protein
MDAFDLSEEEMNHRVADSPYGIARSISGIVINNMIHMGLLVMNGELVGLPTSRIPDRKELLHVLVNDILTEDERLVRSPDTKYGVLSSEFGKIYKRCKEDGITDGATILEQAKTALSRYRLFQGLTLTNGTSPFGSQLAKLRNMQSTTSTDKSSYQEELVRTIAEIFGKGPEFFENFIYGLFQIVYDGQIIFRKSEPGPGDDGVDCEFVLQDPVGFQTRIIIQAKTKQNIKTKSGEKAVREYAGVLLIENADKCIICSNVRFTKGALHKATRIGNLKLVGINRLVDLMMQYEYGVVKHPQGHYTLDQEFFTL